MTAQIKGLHKYTNAVSYEEEQEVLKELVDLNDMTLHQIRSILVNMKVYNNKPKHITRVKKKHYVDGLIKYLKDITDSEEEYLSRLTVSLLKKIIKAIDNDSEICK